MAMRMNSLDLRVVVRRVTVGSAPYSWEIRAADGIIPVQVSPDRFRSMETTLKAGQARLADFISQQPPSKRRQAAQAASAEPAAASAQVSTLPGQEPRLNDGGDKQSLDQRGEEDMECHDDLLVQSGASAPADADGRW